jgi:hypothetical protein
LAVEGSSPFQSIQDVSRQVLNLYSFSLSISNKVLAIQTNLQVHMNAAPGGRDAAIARAKAQVEKAGKVWSPPKPKTLEQGCATTLVAVLDPEIEERSGAYLRDGDVAVDQPFPEVEDQDKLWALSEKLVGERFSL